MEKSAPRTRSEVGRVSLLCGARSVRPLAMPAMMRNLELRIVEMFGKRYRNGYALGLGGCSVLSTVAELDIMP